MIERYARPEMRAIWEPQKKFSHWLKIEVEACEAMARHGLIPPEDAATIRKKAHFEVAEIEEIEKRTRHDVIAFLENVASYVGPAGRWIHFGLTSSDILDTALALQLVEACDILLEDLAMLQKAIAARAIEHQNTPMIGRSHGIHAEPITFGLKLAGMYEEFQRAEERLRVARAHIAVGQISGAVGTHAHLDSVIEKEVCEALGLAPAPISTQIIGRDRHAQLVNEFALIASSIERWATEFRHLQRTEVLEVEEYFARGQKGSSAMPHKRNPIIGERLTGLARVIRGHALAAMENVPLWHERDISHSSVERIILPDATTLLDYMLVKLSALVENLVVYPDNMARNLEITKGLYHSQSILLALAQRGVERKIAYEAVQRASMKTWRDEGDLLENLLSEGEVTAVLSEKEIREAISLEKHFVHIAEKFAKLGIT